MDADNGTPIQELLKPPSAISAKAASECMRSSISDYIAWMSKDGRISAGDLRVMGVQLEDEIPDCATVDASAVTIALSESEVTKDAINIGYEVTITEPFEWVEVNVTIPRKDAEGE